MTRFNSEYGREMGQRAWARRCANLPYPPAAISNYQYDATLSPSALRGWAREMARVVAKEGPPALTEIRHRARLYPHLVPAIPGQTAQVA